MKKRLFPLLIALSALAVSGSAAFYSVFGLSKLFAGASTQVIIMAGSLEFAKLVVASLLYQYWDTINKWLRSYLAIACFVLMIITSGGIYGFLSGAYQSTATQSELLDKSLLILEQKQVRFEESKEDLTIEKTQINKSISDLRVSLSNPQQVSWFDKNSQTVITSTSSSARRALQAELKTSIADRDNINLKLESILDSIGKTDMALLEKEISNEDQRELGPLKYLASTTGWPMDKVVNYFLLLIVFVFDPLAIALVVAANMAFAQIRKPKKEKEIRTTSVPSEELKERVKRNQQKIKMSKPPGLEFDTPYTLEEIKEKWLTTKQESVASTNLEDPGEIDERRMDIIGQNGNDGLHYDEENKTTNVLTSTNHLTQQQIEDLSKEIGKNENLEEDKPVNPKPEDLEKLAKVLNINYDESNIPLDRLTDTTQTLLTKTINKTESEEVKSENKLKYKGRK